MRTVSNCLHTDGEAQNYPSSITFSQLWWNSSQLARLFKVKVALSPDLNTAHWFAKMDLSASVHKQQGALVGFCSKTWTRDVLKVDNTGFFDKMCLGFRSCYTWRIMCGKQQFFLNGVYHFLQVNSTYIYIYIYISGGPLSALTCCVNARLLSAIKKISPLIYSQSWVGSWVYTTQAMMTFTLIF